MLARFESKFQPCPTTGCWLWHGWKNEDGYGFFFLDGRVRLAHRVSWETYKGPIDDGLCVLHTCDVRLCVAPWHLFLGTPAANSADMVAKQRQANGRKIRKSNLSDDDVRQIRALAEIGASQRELARQFSVSQPNIGCIVRREIWKHL